MGFSQICVFYEKKFFMVHLRRSDSDQSPIPNSAVPLDSFAHRPSFDFLRNRMSLQGIATRSRGQINMAAHIGTGSSSTDPNRSRDHCTLPFHTVLCEHIRDRRSPNWRPFTKGLSTRHSRAYPVNSRRSCPCQDGLDCLRTATIRRTLC